MNSLIPPTMQWSCLQLQTTNHCYCNVLDIATLWLFSMASSSLIIPRACFKIGFELWIYNHIIEVFLLWFFIFCRLEISGSSITIAKLLVYFQVNLEQHVTMSGTFPPHGSCSMNHYEWVYCLIGTQIKGCATTKMTRATRWQCPRLRCCYKMKWKEIISKENSLLHKATSNIGKRY